MIHTELNCYILPSREKACRELWWKSPSEWVKVPMGSNLGLELFLELV